MGLGRVGGMQERCAPGVLAPARITPPSFRARLLWLLQVAGGPIRLHL